MPEHVQEHLPRHEQHRLGADADGGLRLTRGDAELPEDLRLRVRSPKANQIVAEPRPVEWHRVHRAPARSPAGRFGVVVGVLREWDVPHVRFTVEVREDPLALVDVQPEHLVGHFAFGDVLEVREPFLVRIRKPLLGHARIVGNPADAPRHRRVASVKIALFDEQHVEPEVVRANSGAHAGGAASHHE